MLHPMEAPKRSWRWRLVLFAVVLSGVVMGGLFVPSVDCPNCPVQRPPVLPDGSNITYMPCYLCGFSKKVSIVNRWRFYRMHGE